MGGDGMVWFGLGWVGWGRVGQGRGNWGRTGDGWGVQSVGQSTKRFIELEAFPEIITSVCRGEAECNE